MHGTNPVTKAWIAFLEHMRSPDGDIRGRRSRATGSVPPRLPLKADDRRDQPEATP